MPHLVEFVPGDIVVIRTANPDSYDFEALRHLCNDTGIHVLILGEDETFDLLEDEDIEGLGLTRKT